MSCIIQINTDENVWVSDSPYIHAFDGLDAVHHQMEEQSLIFVMEKNGFKAIKQVDFLLPNGKKLVRLDFLKSQM